MLLSSRNRKKFPLTGFFVTASFSQNVEWCPCWLHIAYGPFSDRDVQGSLQRNSRREGGEEQKVTGGVRAATVKALLSL